MRLYIGIRSHPKKKKTKFSTKDRDENSEDRRAGGKSSRRKTIRVAKMNRLCHHDRGQEEVGAIGGVAPPQGASIYGKTRTISLERLVKVSTCPPKHATIEKN